jgi:hypothetical protein
MLSRSSSRYSSLFYCTGFSYVVCILMSISLLFNIRWSCYFGSSYVYVACLLFLAIILLCWGLARSVQKFGSARDFWVGHFCPSRFQSFPLCSCLVLLSAFVLFVGFRVVFICVFPSAVVELCQFCCICQLHICVFASVCVSPSVIVVVVVMSFVDMRCAQRDCICVVCGDMVICLNKSVRCLSLYFICSMILRYCPRSRW